LGGKPNKRVFGRRRGGSRQPDENRMRRETGRRTILLGGIINTQYESEIGKKRPGKKKKKTSWFKKPQKKNEKNRIAPKVSVQHERQPAQGRRIDLSINREN